MNVKRDYLLLLAYLTGFGLRLANLPSSIVNGRLFPFDSDPPYHLRRIFLMIHNFPHIPARDPLLAFPNSAQVPWPPFFDLLGAILYVPYSWFCQDPIYFEFLLAIWIPLLAVLTIWFVNRITSALFGGTAGIIAAWIVSISPVHIFISMFGRIDHHVLEPLVILALVAVSLRWIRARHSWQAIIGWSLVMACIVVGAVLSFTLTYYAFFMAIHLAFFLSIHFCSLHRRLKVTYICMWGWVVILSLSFSFSSLWKAFDPWDIEIPGRFWLAFALLSVLFASMLLGWKASHKIDRLVGAIASVGFLVLLAILLPHAHFLWGIVSRSNENFRLVGENNGLFSEGLFAFASHFFYYMTPLSLLAYTTLNKAKESLSNLLLVVFLFVLTIQGVIFYRFMPTWIVVAAPLTAHALTMLDWRTAWKRFAAVAVIAASVMATVVYTRIVWTGEIHYSSELMPSLAWLKANTPTPAPNVYDESAQPSYSVLSNAEFGAFINYWSERPSLDSPFDTDLTCKARIESLKIWMSRREDEAWSLVKKNQVKYILTYPTFEQYGDFSKILGWENQPPTDLLHPVSLSFLASRLHFLNGSAARYKNTWYSALEHFRLIYQTRDERLVLGKSFPTFKIFETVRGAKIRFHSPFISTCKLELKLTDRYGRQWTYQRRIPARMTEFVVPYATHFDNGAIRTASEYQLTTGKKRILFQVNDEQVQNGHIVFVAN